LEYVVVAGLGLFLLPLGDNSVVGYSLVHQFKQPYNNGYQKESADEPFRLYF